MAKYNDLGKVKQIGIGKSAAKCLSDKMNVQRLDKVFSLRRNIHENR